MVLGVLQFVALIIAIRIPFLEVIASTDNSAFQSYLDQELNGEGSILFSEFSFENQITIWLTISAVVLVFSLIIAFVNIGKLSLLLHLGTWGSIVNFLFLSLISIIALTTTETINEGSSTVIVSFQPRLGLLLFVIHFFLVIWASFSVGEAKNRKKKEERAARYQENTKNKTDEEKIDSLFN